MYAQWLSAAVGIWLMAAPAVLGYGGTARDHDHIFGPLIANFAIVAVWEATRGVRLANVPIGAWLLLAPWLLGYGAAETWNSLLCGAAVLGLSLIRGKITNRYGGGWSALWKRGAA